MAEEEEEIYDDTLGVMADEPVNEGGLSAIRKKFETQNVMGLKPAPAGPKPLGIAPKPKYGGGAGLNVSSCNGTTSNTSRVGSAISRTHGDSPLREKSGSTEPVSFPAGKRNSKVNIPAAFKTNMESPSIDKPKPNPLKPIVSPKNKSDANNNANTSSVGKLDLNRGKFEKSSESDKGSSVSPRRPPFGQKPAVTAEKPNSPRGPAGIKVLDTNGPIDFKARLKPVGGKPSVTSAKPTVNFNDSNSSESDSAELRKKQKSYGEKRKSVIRKYDTKKFHKVDPGSLNDSSKAPQKPIPLEEEIDLDALNEEFIRAIQTLDETSKKDHGWTEVEELYDDCGNVVRPISSRVISLIGSRRPKPRSRKKVPLIPDMTEDEEKQWADAGFGDPPPDANENLPPPPQELLEQEAYDDCAVKETPQGGGEDDDGGELYEALPDEPLDSDFPPPPPVGPKPPELPTTPLPKHHHVDHSTTDNVSEGVPDTQTEKTKDAKELEKEKKKREKEEEKKRKAQEKELKKLAKTFGVTDPSILATSVGRGRVKATVKGKKKTDVSVTEGEEVDIIRMVDNPTGKWLIRILTSQKRKPSTGDPAYNPVELIGFCDENNVEVDTSSILNFMKDAKKPSVSEEPASEPQEVYEDVEGEGTEDLVEDEIYEECS